MSKVHLFICPCLFTHCWQKQLDKVSDYVFVPPLTLPWWNDSQDKPLVVGLVFPFLNRPPYQFKQSPVVDELDREVRALRESALEWWEPVLRKFCVCALPLDSLS